MKVRLIIIGIAHTFFQPIVETEDHCYFCFDKRFVKYSQMKILIDLACDRNMTLGFGLCHVEKSRIDPFEFLKFRIYMSWIFYEDVYKI